MKKTRLFIIVIFFTTHFTMQAQTAWFQEKHRPQFHFSPQAHWMNDPNGMVFYKDTYHLFYQYYPDSTVWGPMHWGHATSKDLVHWKHLPIALYPDSLGYIFSGSVVADVNNTSGFKKGTETPLVAIFTYHDMDGEKAGKHDFQTQGIAYSTDAGRTWKKYAQNPVIKNPGKKDFRDPKVFWHEGSKHWVLCLAVADRIQFYHSKNLKDWKLTGEFGATHGSHGGVWECPDLFPLPVENSNETKWVLLVSIGNGAANGGSGTQYFIGNFNGSTFMSEQSPATVKWLDAGTDNYAGVTWSNTIGKNKLFIGWMSNWQYAQKVPTEKWRSAMTLPRVLRLQKINTDYFVKSAPVSNTKLLRAGAPQSLKKEIAIENGLAAVDVTIELNSLKEATATIVLSNVAGNELHIGYNGTTGEFFIDRTKAGDSSFHPGFATKQTTPRISNANILTLQLFADHSSVELFADGGLTTMTTLCFPAMPYTRITINTNNGARVKSGVVYPLKTIWR